MTEASDTPNQPGTSPQGPLPRRDLFTLSAGIGAAAVAGLAAMAPGEARAQAAGGGKLQEVLQRGKLLVGTGSTNAPWHFEDENGHLVGMDIDMARLVAKGLFDDPNKVEFIRQAPDARVPSIVTGKVDIVFQFMTITAGRAQQVAFTIPYYREGIALMLMAGSKYKDYAALKAAGSAVTVVALQNVYAEQFIHLALPDAKVEQFDSRDTQIQALNAGRGDAAELDQSTLRWLLQKFEGRYRDAGYGWMPQTYGAAVPQGDQVWLNFVNSVLHEAMTGVDFQTYAASFKKWFGQDLPTPKIGFPIEYR